LICGSKKRIHGISWVDRVTNGAAMEKKKEIINRVERRKMEYLGHVMRNDTKIQTLQSPSFRENCLEG
jgi:hypothetical protein